MQKNMKRPILYSVLTLLVTGLVGQILLWAFPNGAGVGASLLFILMNLIPMLAAIGFSLKTAECKTILVFLRQAFAQRETITAFLLALAVPVLYYGVSALLRNVTYTGASAAAVLAYFPWTLLQGGLEEVGWRWYLQKHLHVKNSFALKMLVISLIWFLWHIPIYRLPWITAGSSNYWIFYLMILGNTFTLGMVQEFSKGAVPCILAHMLIDTLAAAMLVQSTLLPIVILVAIEIAFSCLIVGLHGKAARKKAAHPA